MSEKENVIGTKGCESRKNYCEYKESCFEEALKKMYCKSDPHCCYPPCTCPPGSCTCPIGTCTCPPGSCTCPEGTCPQTTELVQNPSFEITCTDATCNTFQSWTGTNITKSETKDALTGTVAAQLGSAQPSDATLEQTISGINSGCPCEFTFSANTQNQSNTAQFTAQIIWEPSGAPAIDPAVNPIVMNGSSSGNSYVFIKRITTLAPVGTAYARILFTKTGTGNVLIDDVSFRG